MRNFLTVKDFFDNDKNIHAFFCAETREKDMHSHEFWEIAYVYEGQGAHFTDKGRRTIREGDFIIVSPDTMHSIVSPQKGGGVWVRVCNLIIKPDYFSKITKKYLSLSETKDYKLNEMLNTRFCLHLTDNENLIYNTMISIAHDYKYPDAASNVFIENSIFNLLIYIARRYEASVNNLQDINTKDETLEDLIKFMKSNFGAKMDLEYLAAYTHFSKEYLSRRFKQYTGKNISHFLTEIRIERAKLLLRSTVYPIGDVSSYCGFSSINHFQRAFKRLTSLSPREYRKKFGQAACLTD